ncbi:MAG TPA: hypothetical protein DEQ09_00455, partial [Bacteroidales bacterium]|nr:hypothetical protein [Bacteroidales bacterium]
MKQSLYIVTLIYYLVFNYNACAQTRSSFSGDTDSFSSELITFMGPNLHEEQTAMLNSFVTAWDSTLIDHKSKQLIVSASMSIESKRLRAVPHFIDYIETMMVFINYDIDIEKFNLWLEGLVNLSNQTNSRISDISSFINAADGLIRDKIIYSSNSVTWKTTSNRFTFSNDTSFT